jgi:hypothetical protein
MQAELLRNGVTGNYRLPKTRLFLKLVIEANIAKSKVMNFVTDSNERCFLYLKNSGVPKS